ncbi:hypothetical protein DFJ73DRAFT_876550 [Zopfochytrium polystomum]|nr:hypothetical protein DFJ73DRAFT_876550 [Zopfochytrium polystomum]
MLGSRKSLPAQATTATPESYEMGQVDVVLSSRSASEFSCPLRSPFISRPVSETSSEGFGHVHQQHRSGVANQSRIHLPNPTQNATASNQPRLSRSRSSRSFESTTVSQLRAELEAARHRARAAELIIARVMSERRAELLELREVAAGLIGWRKIAAMSGVGMEVMELFDQDDDRVGNFNASMGTNELRGRQPRRSDSSSSLSSSNSSSPRAGGSSRERAKAKQPVPYGSFDAHITGSLHALLFDIKMPLPIDKAVAAEPGTAQNKVPAPSAFRVPVLVPNGRSGGSNGSAGENFNSHFANSDSTTVNTIHCGTAAKSRGEREGCERGWRERLLLQRLRQSTSAITDDLVHEAHLDCLAAMRAGITTSLQYVRVLSEQVLALRLENRRCVLENVRMARVAMETVAAASEAAEERIWEDRQRQRWLRQQEDDNAAGDSAIEQTEDIEAARRFALKTRDETTASGPSDVCGEYLQGWERQMLSQLPPLPSPPKMRVSRSSPTSTFASTTPLTSLREIDLAAEANELQRGRQAAGTSHRRARSEGKVMAHNGNGPYRFEATREVFVPLEGARRKRDGDTEGSVYGLTSSSVDPLQQSLAPFAQKGLLQRLVGAIVGMKSGPPPPLPLRKSPPRRPPLTNSRHPSRGSVGHNKDVDFNEGGKRSILQLVGVMQASEDFAYCMRTTPPPKTHRKASQRNSIDGDSDEIDDGETAKRQQQYSSSLFSHETSSHGRPADIQKSSAPDDHALSDRQPQRCKQERQERENKWIGLGRHNRWSSDSCKSASSSTASFPSSGHRKSVRGNADKSGWWKHREGEDGSVGAKGSDGAARIGALTEGAASVTSGQVRRVGYQHEWNNAGNDDYRREGWILKSGRAGIIVQRDGCDPQPVGSAPPRQLG